MRIHTTFVKSVMLCLIFLLFIKIWASEPLEITIDRDDGIRLISKFYKSKGPGPLPTVILLHGFPGGEGDIFLVLGVNFLKQELMY